MTASDTPPPDAPDDGGRARRRRRTKRPRSRAPGSAARAARRPAAPHRHPAGPGRGLPALAAATGPVAIDAERASGYRYSSRAYLIQLRREGAGTFLVDPIGFDSLDPLQEALAGTEWILHAATQDLPCLAEVGLVPTALFDTELAGRLLGYPGSAWRPSSRRCSATR